MKKFILCSLVMAAIILPVSLFAGQSFKVQDEHLTYFAVHARNSSATSTTTITGYAYSMAVLASGTEAQFTIHHTTKTFVDGTIAVSSSAAIVAPKDIPLSIAFPTIVKDLRVVTHGLATSSTIQFWIEYGEEKLR